MNNNTKPKGRGSAKIGLVGLPNVGKSSLFNLILRKNLSQVGNYAFCTIEPKVAEADIIDNKLIEIAKLGGSEKTIFARLQCVDIAGLIKGASEGSGLGNKFLSHIRQVDLILHVVRCFENDEISHVEETVDPLRDIKTINTELILADLEMCERLTERNKKNSPLLEKATSILNSNKLLADGDLDEEERLELKALGFITIRPMVFLLNGPGEVAEKVRREYKNSLIVDVSAEELDPQIIKFCCESLGIINFYTVGPKEARSWLIEDGCIARYAAGTIHTDFAKKFVAADVIPCQGFLDQGTKAKASMKRADYIVQPGDICNFKIGK